MSWQFFCREKTGFMKNVRSFTARKHMSSCLLYTSLRKALKEHTKNATTIIVAQRISTILNADQILVLDDGKMAGLGTHRELMKNCEVYRQIAMSQLSEEELANE